MATGQSVRGINTGFLALPELGCLPEERIGGLSG
jgi:hypothetical protein